MYDFAQRAGPFAVDNPHVADAVPAAFKKIVIEQTGNLRGAKRMQVQFTRDGKRDWFVQFLWRHGLQFRVRLKTGDKKPAPFRAGF
jgi:hypothetical protein